MDSPIFSLIEQERTRQEETINLIASENYVSSAVLSATGSVLTNKYAEGYSGARYYGGCQIIDQIESYAISRGRALFDVAHMNVQPHSGSSANLAAYCSVLQPGDTILGMSLSSGGHLTHGYARNFSGNFFKSVFYGVDQGTELINYREIEELVEQHRPKLIIAGASAYSRLIDYEKLATLARRYSCYLLVDMAHIAGLVAAKIIPSPIPSADIVTSTTHKTLRGPRGGFICSNNADLARQIDKAIIPGVQGGPLMHVIAAKAIAFEEAQRPEFIVYQKQVIKNAQVMAKTFQELGYHVVSGGTDTHLFLVRLPAGLTGKLVEETLGQCGIIVNRNTVPGDELSPLITSGIRIGSAAITTRGFRERDAQEVVSVLDDVIKNRHNSQRLAAIKKQILFLCKKFTPFLAGA